MKALVCNAYADPSHLSIEDIPAKAPGAGELRIAVQACSVNFAEVLIVQGLYQVKPALPFVPGAEVAGEVLEVGEGVRGFKVGDRVLGLCSIGGFAEEVVAPASGFMPMPPEMPYEHAAAFPIVYGTSHVALTHRANLQAGETLLVLGAAGGVGLTAVELGKLLGATVIAAASTPEKLALAQAYGADHLINYSGENLRERVKEITGGKGANVIYDPVGGELFDQAMRSIAWEGRLLVIGFASGTIPQLPVNLALVKNCSVVGVYWGNYAQQNPKVLFSSLQQLLGWYSEGKLKPHVSATYPLARAVEAFAALQQRQVMGKVVVLPRT